MDTQERDQRLIKFSRSRAIIAGDYIELYKYERPYSYNWAPVLNNGGKRNKKNERRADNVYRTRQQLIRTIRANYHAEYLPKFVTFTFAENVSDLDTANKLWIQFIRKMRRVFGKVQYVSVIEFQKRGAVHYHVLFFNLPYSDNLRDMLSDLWVWGFIKVKALHNIKDVALYVSKYLTKETTDNRLAGRRAYLTSHNLRRTIQIRDEQAIHALTENLARRNIELAFRGTYTGAYGTVGVYNNSKEYGID